MPSRLVRGPTVEPVTNTEAKAHLRITHTDDDAYIDALITAAREFCEDFQGRRYVASTWKYVQDKFPTDTRKNPDLAMSLPGGVLCNVVSVKYLDTDGNEATLAATSYQIDAQEVPGRVLPNYGDSWESTYDAVGAVRVTYVAGEASVFTANVADVCTFVGDRTATNGDAVQLSTTNALPGGLSVGTLYYVGNSTGSTFTLATSNGGAKIDITDTGTGTHFVGSVPKSVKQAILLLVAEMYESRLPVESAVTTTVERLLWPQRLIQF